MLQTTFKSFSFCCNTEPKQTLKSQKLQQNSFVIPQPALMLPWRFWWQKHRHTQSCSFTPCATRRWGKPQALRISQGKTIPWFSPLKGGGEKQSVKVVCSQYYICKGTNISHPQSSPLTPPSWAILPFILLPLLEFTLPVIMQLIQRDG